MPVTEEALAACDAPSAGPAASPQAMATATRAARTILSSMSFSYAGACGAPGDATCFPMRFAAPWQRSPALTLGTAAAAAQAARRVGEVRSPPRARRPCGWRGSGGGEPCRSTGGATSFRWSGGGPIFPEGSSSASRTVSRPHLHRPAGLGSSSSRIGSRAPVVGDTLRTHAAQPIPPAGCRRALVHGRGRHEAVRALGPADRRREVPGGGALPPRRPSRGPPPLPRPHGPGRGQLCRHGDPLHPGQQARHRGQRHLHPGQRAAVGAGPLPALLGERATRSELLAIPLYGLGLSLFFLDELSPGQLSGNLVALASGLAFAFCIVGLRRAREDAAAAMVWGNLLAALLVLPFWPTGPAARAPRPRHRRRPGDVPARPRLPLASRGASPTSRRWRPRCWCCSSPC